MSFNVLSTNIRGYSKSFDKTVKIDNVQISDKSIYYSILNYLNIDSQPVNVTKFMIPFNAGVEAYYNYFEENKQSINATLIFTSENSNEVNKRETNLILDYLTTKDIPTVVISLKDDGTFIEALLLNKSSDFIAPTTFTKLNLQ